MPSYTLDELLKMMEPQSQRDKSLINQCIEGLGLYAAQQARDNYFSSKPSEMRELVENLVGYWGLDNGQNEPFMEGFLDAFDDKVATAKLSKEAADGTYRQHADTIYGLHRHGEELIAAQGSDAMTEILDVGDLMKELASYWNFESQEIVNDLADRFRAEVRNMLTGITLPGQPQSGVNVGYQIQQAILFNNDRGFVLAHHPKAPSPYVTWAFADRNGERSYDVGSYHSTEERAKLSYISRVTGYMDSYKVTEIPNPIGAVEMNAEQNYNMIDGVRNNEGVPKPDLTDGQTFEEIRELAPEMLNDPSVTKTDMYAYGYGWDGMIPLGKERALQLFDEGYGVYRLYHDDAEGAIDNREEFEEFDGLFGVEDPEWNENANITSFIEVFILNSEKYEKDEASGEWLTLPADADTLCDLFERIGIDRPSEDAFTVTAIRVPHDYIRDDVSKYDSLDELNMLASILSDMEAFEIDKMQAVLTSGVEHIGNGTAALINMLYDDNFQMFDLIDAANPEELGRYWEAEDPISYPEGVSHEEYGRQAVAVEKGRFTEWGYIYFRNKELSQEYDGVVPDEYKITGEALRGLCSKTPELKQPDGKQSVVEKIKAARTAPRTPKIKNDQSNKKSKGGQEL